MAEAITGAVMGGLTIASTGIVVQSAGNLTRQLGGLGKPYTRRQKKRVHKRLKPRPKAKRKQRRRR